MYEREREREIVVGKSYDDIGKARTKTKIEEARQLQRRGISECALVLGCTHVERRRANGRVHVRGFACPRLARVEAHCFRPRFASAPLQLKRVTEVRQRALH